MKKLKKYWDIDCSNGMEVLYKKQIDCSNISKKNLILFLTYLLRKYGLEDDEAIEELSKIPFKKRKEYFSISRTSSLQNGKPEITFGGHVTSISVTATLSILGVRNK